MRQKWTILVLSALLALGVSGCGSASNRTAADGWSYSYDSRYGGDSRYRNGNGVTDGDGLGRAADGTGDDYAGRDESRYREMLRNGYVHDTDGYLLDGENSRS